MPNYRIPSNSDNDANGMWKMNAVRKAREGGEWPDAHIPASWTPYYIRRYSGDTVTITDGNAAATNAGAASTMTGNWSMDANWNNVDAISFNLTQTGSHTGYKIFGAGFGVSTSSWMSSGAPTWMGKIYSGNGCVTANVIYDTGFVYPGYPMGSDVWGDYFAGVTQGASVGAFQFLRYPDPSTPYSGSGAMPLLSFGSTYTIAFAYRVGGTTAVTYRGSTAGNFIGGGYGGNTITLSDGNVITQNIATCGTFSDSVPFGSNNGTNYQLGIFPVMPYLFLV